MQAEIGLALAAIIDGDLDRADEVLRAVQAAPQSTAFGSAGHGAGSTRRAPARAWGA